MKIAIMINKANLERYTAPGEIPAEWELVHLGAGQPDEERLIATGADAVLIDPILPLPARVIRAMPNLKLVQTLGVGFNHVDLDAAREAGVFVCNNAGVNAVAVAEQAILLMLGVLRHFREGDAAVWAAKQIEFKDRCFEHALTELSECHVGLVGLGAIGKEVAVRLHAFGCRVSYCGPNRKADDASYHAAYCTLDELLSTCDIVSLHAPVRPETMNLMDETRLRAMKKTAVLINTARGELVDQDALCRALTEGWIAGAGLDTLSPEPVQPDNPLLRLSPEAQAKVALSPHIGGITAGNFYRSYANVWRAMRAVEAGERPANIVNGL